MNQDQLASVENSAQQASLNEEIEKLKRELYLVSRKLDTYIALLRSQLTEELITVQELTVLYKAQKQNKKSKRLEQKKKGKNYAEPKGLMKQEGYSTTPELMEDDIKEKKRLYREAMLYVHPDNFSMNDKLDLATELTTRLVEIYKKEDLATLKAFHAHLFSNIDLSRDTQPTLKKVRLAASIDAYLIKVKEELEKEINALKSRHIYHVLTTYQDPSTFIDELRDYYQDRISKLKNRTRTEGLA